VDSQTGTIRIVGAFPNPKNLLRPGQFGRVSAVTGMTKGAFLIPQRCVTELQGKYQVAVVKPDNKVSIRNVEVGTREGDMWVILKGVSVGDQVISQGLEKVRDGSPVSPKPESPAAASAARPAQPGE
jgi:membrane fusion protein (multidrug efflux system)